MANIQKANNIVKVINEIKNTLLVNSNSKINSELSLYYTYSLLKDYYDCDINDGIIRVCSMSLYNHLFDINKEVMLLSDSGIIQISGELFRIRICPNYQIEIIDSDKGKSLFKFKRNNTYLDYETNFGYNIFYFDKNGIEYKREVKIYSSRETLDERFTITRSNDDITLIKIDYYYNDKHKFYHQRICNSIFSLGPNTSINVSDNGCFYSDEDKNRYDELLKTCFGKEKMYKIFPNLKIIILSKLYNNY